jgi:hypothetical protein
MPLGAGPAFRRVSSLSRTRPAFSSTLDADLRFASDSRTPRRFKTTYAPRVVTGVDTLQQPSEVLNQVDHGRKVKRRQFGSHVLGIDLHRRGRR